MMAEQETRADTAAALLIEGLLATGCFPYGLWRLLTLPFRRQPLRGARWLANLAGVALVVGVCAGLVYRAEQETDPGALAADWRLGAAPEAMTALVHLSADQCGLAELRFQQDTRQSPKSATLWTVYAAVANRLKHYPDAEQRARRAIALIKSGEATELRCNSPAVLYADAKLHLAGALAAQGKVAEARQQATEAAKFGAEAGTWRHLAIARAMSAGDFSSYAPRRPAE